MTQPDRFKRVSSVAACLAISQAAFAADPPKGPLAGTYEILICNSSCPTQGDENVWVKGRLVLLPAALNPADVKQFESAHSTRTHADAPNACFTLEKLAGRGYQGYAGIEKDGLTTWAIEGAALRVTLFQSPDAFYVVTAQRTQTGLEGTGVSSGAGVAAPVGVSPDKVVLRRVGAADFNRCK